MMKYVMHCGKSAQIQKEFEAESDELAIQQAQEEGARVLFKIEGEKKEKIYEN